MKKILGCFAVLAAVCVTGSVAQGAAACAAGQDVLSAGFACSIGAITFQNFSTTNYNSNGGTLDFGTVNSTGFTLQTILPTNGTPSFNDVNLQFEVLGPVTGIGLSLNGSLLAFATENVCMVKQSPAGSGNCPAGNLLAYIGAFGNNGVTSATFANVNQDIWIFKDISDGNAPLSETTQIYSTSSVPEPMTLSMMGVGLLGLSLISRRRKKS